jgi:hypothetical protein
MDLGECVAGINSSHLPQCGAHPVRHMVRHEPSFHCCYMYLMIRIHDLSVRDGRTDGRIDSYLGEQSSSQFTCLSMSQWVG